MNVTVHSPPGIAGVLPARTRPGWPRSQETGPGSERLQSVWSRPEAARSFLRHYLPAEVVAELCMETLQLVRDAFVDEHLKSHYSELLYRLIGRDGRPAYVYTLLEHENKWVSLSSLPCGWD